MLGHRLYNRCEGQELGDRIRDVQVKQMSMYDRQETCMAVRDHRYSTETEVERRENMGREWGKAV